MRKKMLCILLTFVLCLSLLPLSAGAADVGYEVTGGKIYFDPATGTITGCDESVTAADIPAAIYDIPVTAIGESAFFSLDYLTSVTIPNGVEIIGESAFYNCEGLTSISIPSSVKEIGASAFRSCYNLKTVTLSEGLQMIGSEAFCFCTSLERIRIPDSVTDLRRDAFDSCQSLRELTIGSGITLIPTALCDDCESLEKIEIPPTVTTIEAVAFRNCNNVVSLTIPATVTSIDQGTFSGCDKLESLVIENGIKTIPDSAFFSCENLKRVDIQSDVEIIGPDSFSFCSGLSDIFIPQSVKEIHYEAFNQCEGLSDIYYEGSLADWAKIETGSGNDALASATIHFNSSGLPEATPADPTTPVEPTEPTESTEPTDPTTPVEPVTPAEPNQTFTDVPTDAYYADAVKWAVDKGVTDGTSPTTFSPKATVTRGQAVTFLWRAVGKPVPQSAYCPFLDVKTSDYYYLPVLWAMEQGVTDGTSATTFSPDATLTRAHIVTFLWRTAGQPDNTGASQWYADAVSWGQKNDLLSGTTEAFTPSGNCPRSDVVTYLFRADQRGVH